MTDFSNMFRDARSFNQPLSAWSTGSAQNFYGFFCVATAFDQNINTWDVSSVTNFGDMFREATSFNQPLSAWSTGSARTFSGTFCVATAFNQNINSWNTASVTDFSSMFQDASSFNQPLSAWSTGSAQNFYGFFCVATAFNQNINSWNTASVTDFSNMFQEASRFDQDISSWSVVLGTTFQFMFDRSSFSQNLCDWGVDMVNAPAARDVVNMFRETPCPSTADPNLAASPISPLCHLCADSSTSSPTIAPTSSFTTTPTAPSGAPFFSSLLISNNAVGNEAEGDCYFVDIVQTDTIGNPNGCSAYTMEFSYYNGGEYLDKNTGEFVDTGQPREDYQTVNVVGTIDCNDSSQDVCEISVAGVGTCNGCSYNAGFFTLTDCSNLPGIFRTGVDQTYQFYEDGVLPDYPNQFFSLEFNQARCDAYTFP